MLTLATLAHSSLMLTLTSERNGRASLLASPQKTGCYKGSHQCKRRRVLLCLRSTLYTSQCTRFRTARHLQNKCRCGSQRAIHRFFEHYTGTQKYPRDQRPYSQTLSQTVQQNCLTDQSQVYRSSVNIRHLKTFGRVSCIRCVSRDSERAFNTGSDTMGP